jgi:hypothetical protein
MPATSESLLPAAPRSDAPPPFVRAVWRAVTWKGLLAVQGMGLAFAVLWHLRHGARPPPHDWPAHIVSNAVGALLVMLAALIADETLRRGVRFWCAYPLALFAASGAAAIVQWCLQQWPALAFAESGGPLAVAVAIGFSVFTLGGLAMLAYINRQSAERMLQGVRAAELDRVRVERRLIEARLAAAQARIDPGAVFRQLAEVRDLYASARPEADEKLESLIRELRANVAQGVDVSRPRESAP